MTGQRTRRGPHFHTLAAALAAVFSLRGLEAGNAAVAASLPTALDARTR